MSYKIDLTIEYIGPEDSVALYTNLIEIFKVKLFEDGIPVFHLHPACSPEFYQKLVPVCLGKPMGI